MQPFRCLTSKAFGLTVEQALLPIDRGSRRPGGRGVDRASTTRGPAGAPTAQELERIIGKENLAYGELDITFHRDDFRHRATPPAPSITQLDFTLDDRKVVLVDDVLYTGRTIRAGLDALLAFGQASQRATVGADRSALQP